MLSSLLNQIKLVYAPNGQSNMNSTLDFCPRPAKKETNVPLKITSRVLRHYIREAKSLLSYDIYCGYGPKMIVAVFSGNNWPEVHIYYIFYSRVFSTIGH